MNCENSKYSASESTLKKSQDDVFSANQSVSYMNTCSCRCGFTIGSMEFIRLHVESQEEQDQRLAVEQEAQAEYYADMPEPHLIMCNCTECN